MAKNEFNIASNKHLNIVKKGLDHISGKVWDSLGTLEYNLYVKPDRNLEIYLVRFQDIPMINSLREKKFIIHTGIYFGFIQDKEFHISLEGAEFLYYNLNKDIDLELKTISIDKDATKSFMYGNNIDELSFVKKPKILNRKEIIFVLNNDDEFIGIGFIFKKAFKPYKSDKGARLDLIQPKEEIQLRNLVDYGYYVRRGH